MPTFGTVTDEGVKPQGSYLATHAIAKELTKCRPTLNPAGGHAPAPLCSFLIVTCRFECSVSSLLAIRGSWHIESLLQVLEE